MSTTATLPLPLELTQPVELGTSLEDALREAFDIANAKYNHETQVSENPEGIPLFTNGGTTSSQQSKSYSGLIVIDITVDVQIDDNDF